MESKHKNALIVALLAVVLVMAVGYAAFAQSLTINSTATIEESTDGKQNWKVAFVKNTDDVEETAGATGSTPDGGEITFNNDYLATISAQLDAPGDSIVYTFTVQNMGTIKASLTAPQISLTSGGVDSESSNTIVKNNNITFTVSGLSPSTLAPNEQATFTVTATIDENADISGVSSASGNNSASIQVSFTANQTD